MKTIAKDKYKGRMPTEAETKRKQLVADIFGPIVAYSIATLFCMLAFTGGPSTSNSIGGGIVFGLVGAFFAYFGLVGIIKREHGWQSYYAFIWGVLGLVPVVNQILG